MDQRTSARKSLTHKADAAPALVGVVCGITAALFWALGFVATRHGLKAGFTPVDLLVHRYVWSGVAFLPLVVRAGISDLCGIGWGRGLALMVLGGPVMSLISYSGFLFVPLGHGSVIQPSCATLGGILLAALVLKERISASRVVGAVVIVGGLCVIGAESIGHIGLDGVHGDLIFVLTGTMFAGFGAALRRWRVSALSAASVINVLSLLLLPLYAATGGPGRIAAIGVSENAVQALAQGILAGPAALYLYAVSVTRLGVARAAVFPACVPALTLLVGWLLIGEPPTALQAAGLVTVLCGFWLAQRQR
ncbi:DMT family transporter [Bradyrhizobium sp.]|uniref:DMT family transporter n=1 Tax=Bradyrhizobium sp. TaxID=376 RepID=UPI0023906F4D|nr:DMT family transporter [Bradyrhizobium sp.]MDE2377629.1 DMT family transporter [Bradyrhizobium sp.]